MTRRLLNSLDRQHTRNPAEYLALGALTSGTVHGYDIYRHLQDQLGVICRLGKSQVYALLSKLEREGLVVHEKLHQESLPARKMFYLTPLGREVLNLWARRPVSSVRDLRVEFLTKLHFARMIGPEAEKVLLESQVSVCREKASAIGTATDKSRSRIEREALDYRLALVIASLRWLEGLLGASGHSQQL